MPDEPDPYEKGQQVEKFNAPANEKTADRTRELPSGKKISEAGLTTQSSLQYEATRELKMRHPEPTPDDPEGWNTADRKAEEQRQKDIDNRRQAFKEQFAAARREFNDRSNGRDR